MDSFDITDYVTGVMTDGTDFDFDALCSSITKMIIVQMIVECIQAYIENEYPSNLAHDPDVFRWVFDLKREELIESVSKLYNEIYSLVKFQLTFTLFDNHHMN